MPRKIDTVPIKIPKQSAEVIFKLITPMLDKYLNNQLLQSKFIDAPNNFDLKTLCISCYTQGLMDAQQLPVKEEE